MSGINLSPSLFMRASSPSCRLCAQLMGFWTDILSLSVGADFDSEGPTNIEAVCS